MRQSHSFLVLAAPGTRSGNASIGMGLVGPALESLGAVIPPAPLQGVLTVPGALMSLTLPKLGMNPRFSSGLTIDVTLKLEIAGGSTDTGASRLNSVVNPGVDSAFVLGVFALGVMGVNVFGLIVKLVTPNAGVLTVGESALAFRFAPLEKVGALEVDAG
jgi:hypothetical protein